ncbi:hypothetical protein PVK06_035220 [Gossypium arboreum]|uniref:Uncharacterized protein n=1 Tax=Gossypium arboreum TaxID=29729 RepID=A0ABR0NID8_GOSAR|nr:hypothetical protein PVK06_035220 [Gossypium arboreum]
MGSEEESCEKTERKETWSDKSLLDGPNLVNENPYELKLESSQVEKEKKARKNPYKTKDSRTNLLEEGENDASLKAQV